MRPTAAVWGGVASIAEALLSVTETLPDWALPEGLEAANLRASVAEMKALVDTAGKLKPVEWSAVVGGELGADLSDLLSGLAAAAETVLAPAPLPALAAAAPGAAGPGGAAARPSVVNNTTITVNGAGQDENTLARAIGAEVRRAEEGALYD